MRGCAHGSLMGACERQRARGLGSGGAGPEGVVKRQRSGARSVPWRRALVSTGGGSCGRGLLVGPGCGCPLPRGAGWCGSPGMQSQARGGLSERQRTKPLR